MAFQSLSTRLGALPLILAGPILRRVEKDKVCVWFALKESASIRLEIYNEFGVKVMFSSQTSTVQIGAHLHVILVQADTFSAGVTQLNADKQYYYNVFFPPVTSGSTERDLTTPSVRDGLRTVGTHHFGYGAFADLPSFALPPSDLNDLRVIHGSCRKPHGEGPDALRALDTMINTSMGDAEPAKTRPHQLFMTGDQIYADDVSDAMLHMIQDAYQTLVIGTGGLDESLPDVPKGGADLAPSRRFNLVHHTKHKKNFGSKTANFTAEKDSLNSHLMYLGEYYCMYLFVWSDVLWPDTFGLENPTFSEVYAGQSDKIEKKDVTIYDGKYTETYSDIRTEIGEEFHEHFHRVFIEFRQSLSKIRRALANTPTYMIFDDHDVTDDWNFNQKWSEDVGGSLLGRRIVSNAVTAYALFQGWGNTPERFGLNTSGADLLSTLDLINGNDYTVDITTTVLDGDLTTSKWDTIERLIGVTNNYADVANRKELRQDRLNDLYWAFHIKWDKHEAIVLDTRMERAFTSREDRPVMLSDTALLEQLPLNISSESTNLVTLLISPQPIFGVPSVLGIKTLTNTKILGIKRIKNDLELDMEDWELAKYEHEKLATAIAQIMPQTNTNERKGKLIILSGDVHYGFANRYQYWANKLFTEDGNGINLNSNMVWVQLCASSMHNEENSIKGSFFPHEQGYNPYGKGWFPFINQRKVGYNSGGKKGTYDKLSINDKTDNISTQTVKLKPKKVNGVFQLNLDDYTYSGSNVMIDTGEEPDWKYRIDYFIDREGETRNVDYTKRPVLSQSVFSDILDMMGNHKDYKNKWGNGKEIVGANNLGEVRFFIDGITDTDQKIIQKLWWSMNTDPANSIRLAEDPHTVYEVSFGFNDSNFPKPTL